MTNKLRLIPVALLSLAILFLIVGFMNPGLMGLAKLTGAIALILTVFSTLDLKSSKSMWD